jgi:hypothetical protein
MHFALRKEHSTVENRIFSRTGTMFKILSQVKEHCGVIKAQ